jgi:hypothetical protein
MICPRCGTELVAFDDGIGNVAGKTVTYEATDDDVEHTHDRCADVLAARCKALEAERDRERAACTANIAHLLEADEKVGALACRVAELESVPTRTDHEIYADAKRIKALEVERSILDEKWREYETHYILPLFDRATKMGFDLQQMVHDNPGKNCSMLFADALTRRVAELESWVGRLRQELGRFKGDPLVDIALEDTVSQVPRKEG